MSRPRVWTGRMDRQLAEMYRDGKSVEEIAGATGRTPKAVEQRAKVIGLRRPAGKARRAGRKPAVAALPTDASYAEWRRKKHGGMPPKTMVPWPEYTPQLPDRAFDDDTPLGAYR